LALVADYILRWFAHVKTVTHPNANLPQCTVTSLMHPTILQTATSFESAFIK